VFARHSTLLSCAFICGSLCISLYGQTQPFTPDSGFSAARIGKVEVNPHPGGLTIRIAVSAPIVPESSRLANPDRLVFDFPGFEPSEAGRHISIDNGPVSGLRLSLFSVHPPVTRVVVDLKERLEFQVNGGGNEILIEIPFPKGSGTAPADSIQRAADLRKEPPPPSKQSLSESETLIPNSQQPGAYHLMARARNLSIADLQPLEDKAAAGDAEAQTTMALAYHAGVLLRKDDAESLRLLHQAADQGYMAAEESLGIFAESGIGMSQPAPTEAYNWYRKAVQQGSLDAATNIGLMYANGKGIARDPEQAVHWFRRAAVGGDASAQYNLALMYERGEGVVQDYKEVVHWLALAANQNLVPAMLELADILLQPPNSAFAADVGRSVRYYEKAADLGNGYAQVVLGSIYSKGLEGKVDYEQSVKWYRKAALQGERDGQLGLGVSYALGHGVPVDYVEARRLLTAAADQGQLEAQYDLAIMCEEGKGGPVDHDLAVHYYQVAAENGMLKAQYRYGMFLAKSGASQSDRIAAYKWLLLSQNSIHENQITLSGLRKSMSEQEIAEAEREVDTYRLAHPRGDR
jgi:uncharacterized protein